jgi:hypothetical protein
LRNCIALDNYFYVWFEVDGDSLVMELEAEVDDGVWVGLGVSDTGSMIGSDVTITGFLNSTPRAIDYFLTAKSQCNYNSGANRGVCPDSGISTCPNAVNGTLGSLDVKLISGARVDGIQRIRYRRKLDTGDACDRAWVRGGNVIVWGTGPITVTPAQMVVNIHGVPNVAGRSGHSPNEVQQRLDVFNNGGIPFACVVPPERTPIESERPCAAKQLVRGVTNFTVTIDNYVTYPNPPSWGVSFHFDGFGETPEIVVERGQTYTFVVAASDNHPFYIVDNDQGGQVNATERVFAGNTTTFGTRANPATLRWTVPMDAPSLLYYQCATHIKLGWRIYVVDAGQQVRLPADTATICKGALTTSEPMETSTLSSLSTTATSIEEETSSVSNGTEESSTETEAPETSESETSTMVVSESNEKLRVSIAMALVAFAIICAVQ